MKRIDRILSQTNATDKEKRLIRSYIMEGINTCTVGMDNMRQGPLFDTIAYRKLAEDRQGLERLCREESYPLEDTLFD